MYFMIIVDIKFCNQYYHFDRSMLDIIDVIVVFLTDWKLWSYLCEHILN